jgi:hypothetical protein
MFSMEIFSLLHNKKKTNMLMELKSTVGHQEAADFKWLHEVAPANGPHTCHNERLCQQEFIKVITDH